MSTTLTPHLLTKFEAHLLTHQRVARNTFLSYQRDLKQFVDYVQSRGLTEVTMATVVDYQTHSAGQGRSARSRARALCALRKFYTWLQEFQGGPESVIAAVARPAINHKVPRVCSTDQIARLLEVADNCSERDRLILYLLYSTGMRVSELVGLRWTDIHEDTAILNLRGKGGKHRAVPLIEPVLVLLKSYAHTKGVEYIFAFGSMGKPLSRTTVWRLVKKIAQQAGIAVTVSPHTFRHSLATHSLQQGWDLRSLQMMLGHERLSTVQIYTHVDATQLRAVYGKKHPRR